MLTTLAAVALAAPVAVADLPPAFTDAAYEPTLAANAGSEDGLLLVKFTAEWCAPCKAMDRTTWSDAGVVGYLKEHGITAIAVDVDDHAEIARANGIRAMPTMVVFRAGREFDRAVGGMDAAALTGWLDGVRAGRTRGEAPSEDAGERAGRDGGVDVRQRFEVARGLVRNGDDAKATAELVWLWNNMLEHRPSMSGVRVSFMTRYMGELARRSEVARAAFTELRDALDERVEADGAALSDWLVLNIRVLGDDEAVRAWVERVWERPTGPDTLRSVEHIVGDWLIEQEEWAKAGVAQPSAARFIAHERGVRESFRQADRVRADRDVMQEVGDRRYIDNFAAYHAACLAAGRDEDAWRAAEALLEDLPTDRARAGLCRDALRAGAVRPRHADIAARIQGLEGERLLAQIREALAEN